MDTYLFIAGGADVAVDVLTQRDRILQLSRRKGNPPSGKVFKRAAGRQTTVPQPTCARLFAAR